MSPGGCTEREVDVAIVGGGPAGAAAALTLLRYTQRRVAVIERSAFEAPRVGEAASSSLRSLLDFVGASHVLGADTAHASCAAAAAWGSPVPMVRQSMLTSQGDGLLLDRRAFDARLCGEVEARGGELLLRHGLRRATRHGERWRLELVGATGEPAVVWCRFAIDASGRTAGPAADRARRRRARARDRAVHPVPAVRPRGLRSAARGLGVLAAAGRAGRAGVGRDRRRRGVVRSAVVDGVGYALWSGSHAARLAEDVLLGPSSFATDYCGALQRQYAQYLDLRRRFYRLEQRWPDRPFWRHRHGDAAVA